MGVCGQAHSSKDVNWKENPLYEEEPERAARPTMVGNVKLT